MKLQSKQSTIQFHDSNVYVKCLVTTCLDNALAVISLIQVVLRPSRPGSRQGGQPLRGPDRVSAEDEETLAGDNDHRRVLDAPK